MNRIPPRKKSSVKRFFLSIGLLSTLTIFILGCAAVSVASDLVSQLSEESDSAQEEDSSTATETPDIDPTPTETIDLSPMFEEATAYRENSEYQEAIDTYTKILEIDPTNVDALIGRGESYERYGYYDLGFEDFQTALEVGPDNPAAYRKMGEALLAKMDFYAAADLIETAFAKFPDDQSILILQAGFYHDLGYYWEAIDIYDYLISIDADDLTLVYSNRGASLSWLEEYEVAIEDYSKALEIDPDDGWTYISRARALTHLYRWDEARADLQRALEVEPRNSLVYCYAGETYYEYLDDYEAAVQVLTAALEFNSRAFDCLNQRGTVHVYSGNYQQAVADFEAIIEADPSYLFAYNNIGWAYNEMGEYEKAIPYLTHIVETDPFPNAYKHRGNAYFFLGEYELALEDLNQFIYYIPDECCAVYLYRAIAHFGLGNLEEGLRDMETAFEIDFVDVGRELSNIHYLTSETSAGVYQHPERDGVDVESAGAEELGISPEMLFVNAVYSEMNYAPHFAVYAYKYYVNSDNTYENMVTYALERIAELEQ